MAPPVRFELTTQRLTAACSATELQGSDWLIFYALHIKKSSCKKKKVKTRTFYILSLINE